MGCSFFWLATRWWSV